MGKNTTFFATYAYLYTLLVATHDFLSLHSSSLVAVDAMEALRCLCRHLQQSGTQTHSRCRGPTLEGSIQNMVQVFYRKRRNLQRLPATQHITRRTRRVPRLHNLQRPLPALAPRPVLDKTRHPCRVRHSFPTLVVGLVGNHVLAVHFVATVHRNLTYRLLPVA